MVNWRRHALERMLERGLSRASVKNVIHNGEVIEHYGADKPFPSKLLYAEIDNRPIHVVIAQDTGTNECYVVTAYIPSIEYFENDFRTRKTNE